MLDFGNNPKVHIVFSTAGLKKNEYMKKSKYLCQVRALLASRSDRLSSD
jgi:hypothetical protein